MPHVPLASASSSISCKRIAGAAGSAGSSRQHLERQRLQCVAHEERGRLVIGLVAGRSTAAQVIIVHRRQIVVHQRVRMYELDGAGGRLDLVLAQPDGASAWQNSSAGRIRLPPPSTL